MAYEQVGQFVEHVRSVHARLRKAARVARVATNDERRALLFELIEGHEKHLDEALERASAGGAGSEAIMKTWLQFPQDEKLESLARELPEDPEAGVAMDDVVECVVRTQSDLMKSYELLAAHSSAPRVRSFFESMTELEQDARRRFIRAELRAHDA